MTLLVTFIRIYKNKWKSQKEKDNNDDTKSFYLVYYFLIGAFKILINYINIRKVSLNHLNL